MQKTPVDQPPDAADRDARAAHATLVHWQRRARAFAWACGIRVEPVASRDED